MNSLAKALNQDIIDVNPAIYDMLSEFGKNIYMPKGIITQGNEAKEKAYKYNATVGIATAKGKAIYLKSMNDSFVGLEPEQIFTYAPTAGLPELRKVWVEKMVNDNTSLKGKVISLPIVTAALTHGVSLISDMFVDKGDILVLPDMFWDNYTLAFGVKNGAEFATFKTFNDSGRFNVDGLISTVKERVKSVNKVIVLLNFPNNPTGYSPSKDEVDKMADSLTAIANSGKNIVVICDDAYFGLYHTDDCYKQSVFSSFVGRSKHLLAVKLDGPTKENFAWGFRVGFLTFGATDETVDESKLLKSLETKVTGMIRGGISSCPHPSQSIILKALKGAEFYSEREECNKVIGMRATKLLRVLEFNRFDDMFTAYPFNSGYFMCIKLNGINAEALRVHLLNKYGIGVISNNETDIRIAFSSVDEDNIEDLILTVYNACKEMKIS